MRRKDGNTLYCTFCGLSQHEVKRLIAGPRVFACNECIDLMHAIVHDQEITDELIAGPGRVGMVVANLESRRTKASPRKPRQTLR